MKRSIPVRTSGTKRLVTRRAERRTPRSTDSSTGSRAGSLAGSLAATAVALATIATGTAAFAQDDANEASGSERSFALLASFAVADNLPPDADPLTETSAEIVAVDESGELLVYTDSPLGGIGFVDIADPSAPAPGGFLALDGEPTSLVVDGRTAHVGLNTSASYVEPSGQLVTIDLDTRETLGTCELGGQPDAVALSPAGVPGGAFLAVAIENERDEELGDGAPPQMPAGSVVLVPLVDGALDCEALRTVDLGGLAERFPEDPEPEFVDINAAGEVVVSLQENNHLVVLDRDGGVLAHFSAGATDLAGIDVEEDGALRFDAEQPGRLREPDAVHWLDETRFVSADEGDLDGGSRGFTVFSKTGEVLQEGGTTFEYAAIRAGHYPDERSGNKGIEPEGLETATFGDQRYAFVLAERASLVGVFEDGEAGLELAQLLPTGIAPEGAVAIPARNLLAVAAEADLGADGGARSQVTLYELSESAPAYPMLASSEEDDVPIGWGALSGLAADPDVAGVLYAVSDSFYRSLPRIFTIDANERDTGGPARIVDALTVTRDGAAAQQLDLEGIAVDGEGGFWLASEGRHDRLVPHALHHVGADGEIDASIPFPPELLAHERRFGAEGIALVDGTLWIALQRPWGDDAENTVKLLAHDIETGEWRALAWPLDEAPERASGGGWVGLSELAVHEGHLYAVERDNAIGAEALVKRLYRTPLDALAPVALGEALPVVEKTLVRDLLPVLREHGVYVQDKVEGFAIDAAGTPWLVTDNDGVDDASGETLFLELDTLTSP